MPIACASLASGGKPRLGWAVGTLVLAAGFLCVLPGQLLLGAPDVEAASVVTLAVLVGDYDANEIKANRDYRNKKLEVSGLVFGTQDDAGMTRPFVYLVDDNHENQIALKMKTRDERFLALMTDLSTANVPVKFTGTCIGLEAELVTLDDPVMLEPTAASAAKSIEDLIAKADAASFERAQELLAAYTKLKFLDEAAAKPLAQKLADAKKALAADTEKRWAAAVRGHISKGEYKKAEQAVASAVAAKVDDAVIKKLRDELADAVKARDAKQAGVVEAVRGYIVAADSVKATDAIEAATKDGSLDAETVAALTNEATVASDVRASIKADKPYSAAGKLKDAASLSEPVRKQLQTEVDAAVADYDKRVATAIENVRALVVKAEMEKAETARADAEKAGLIGPKLSKVLKAEASAAIAIRAKIKAEAIVTARAYLAQPLPEPQKLPEPLHKALSEEIEAAYKTLSEAATKANVVKVKLKDGTEITLDFTCVADTTKIVSAEITLEDTTGSRLQVWVKVKFSHFAVDPDARETFGGPLIELPGTKPNTMPGTSAQLDRSGETTLKIKKGEIKDKKVTWVLHKK